MAQVAGKQAQAALDLALEALEAFNWAARGSWMSQEAHREKDMPDASAFLSSALGKGILRDYAELSEVRKRLRTYTIAASHDPRAT